MSAAPGDRPVNPFDPVLHGITWPGMPAPSRPPSRRLVEELRAGGVSVPGRSGTCLACRRVSGARRVPAAEVPRGPFVLPVPEGPGIQSIEIHTLRYGDPDWMPGFSEAMDAWCARHGMPLRVTTAWDAREFPHGKFATLAMMRGFLAGDAEWMMFLDADVMMHPLAPRPSFDRPGFHIRFDQPFQVNPRVHDTWVSWVRGHCGTDPPADWVYRNSGVWAVDRASAEKFLSVAVPPYIMGTLEQNQWNWWLLQAVERHGLEVYELPTEWNRTIDDIRPAWAFHCYGPKKRNLMRFRERLVLPDEVKRLDDPPPVPDFGAGAVVWPYLPHRWDGLWFSHRSVVSYWSEKDWPLVLIGPEAPAWWPGEFIREVDYARALWVGTRCAENVLWMNDDIFLLAGQSPASFRRVPSIGDCAGVMAGYALRGSVWRGFLGQTLLRLHHHGRPPVNYSTHTPYLYRRDRVEEVFDVFGCGVWKFPFETAYHGWHRTPRTGCGAKASGARDMDGEGKLWLNVQRRELDADTRASLVRRFGSPDVAGGIADALQP